MDKKELILTVIVFIAVAALAYLFTAWINGQNAYVFDFKVNAQGNAVDAIEGVFNKNESLILKQELTPEGSRANTAVAAATSELVYASLITGLKVYNYGSIDGIPLNASCNANNSFCGVPDITIRVDYSTPACNCINIHSNRTMEIIGSTDFLMEKAVNLRKLVYLAKTV